MVQGFNHNIKHKGKLFHIQTEDSGRDNPHIITHVFVGGNILASKKTSYADIVKAERLEQIVRELMEEQHKSVLRNLINGVYDGPADGEAKSAPAASPFAGDGEEPSKTTKSPVAATTAGAASGASVAAIGKTPIAPKPAAPGAGEKSLDEIILSYLADREE